MTSIRNRSLRAAARGALASPSRAAAERSPSPKKHGARKNGAWALALSSCLLWLVGCAAPLAGPGPQQANALGAEAARTAQPPELAGGGCDPKSAGCVAEEERGLPLAEAQAGKGRKLAYAAVLGEGHPLDGMDEQAVERQVRDNLLSLGSMSFGPSTNGALLNAVHMPKSDRWVLVDPWHAWGTQETIDYIAHSIDKVHEQFPGTQRLYVGDISGEQGGHLRPHASHQAGRDVDLGFYYKRRSHWYRRATRRNLDRPRTWALVKALITETDVRYIFLDRRVQRMLRAHALRSGEDPAWLRSVFDGRPGQPAIIRHEPGHATHLHVRFYNPIAAETARRCYAALEKHGRLPSLPSVVRHRVRRGETLSELARRYGTSATSIQATNRLRGSRIRAGRVYRIPVRTAASPPPAFIARAPDRRLPPSSGSSSRVAKR